MNEAGRGLFREKSLERLSSPERLDQLVRVADRRTWIPLATLGLLVAALLAWAVLGKVPVKVEGQGILVRPRQVLPIQAPGSGYLEQLDLRVGQLVEAGQVLGRIARTDLERQLELERAKLVELVAQERAVAPLGLTASIDGRLPEVRSPAPGGFELRISRRLAEDLRARSLEALERERRRLEEELRLARALADNRRERLAAQQRLHADGVVSRETLVTAEADQLESLTRVSALEAKLSELTPRRLGIEEHYLARLEEISDREQEIADVERAVARLETQLAEQTRIVAEHRARILEVTATRGAFLAPGQVIGSMLLSETDHLVSLSYFTVRDGKRLAPGLPTEVTPDTVERERFGGIRGKITAVSALPVSLGEAENVIGNRELAETLLGRGYRMQVFAELERDAAAPSGFRWTSSRGPAIEVSAGTTTTARVTVDQRAPITFVLPFLRSAAGID